jgi:hypothetical protein
MTAGWVRAADRPGTAAIALASSKTAGIASSSGEAAGAGTVAT